MLDKDFDEGKKRIADILLQQPKSRYNLDKSYYKEDFHNNYLKNVSL